MPAHRTTPEQFWARFDKSGDCWLWTGGIDLNGYGQAYWANRKFTAHRLAYTLAFGPIPAGMLVCHRCDVRHCGRPEHLFLGTPLDNTRDMIAKGRAHNGIPPRLVGDDHPFRKNPDRAPRGAQISTTRLTETQVQMIRVLAAHGFTQNQVALAFGITRANLFAIVTRKTWRLVPDH